MNMTGEIISAISDACKKLFGLEPAIMLERPEEKFGDLSTNIAMQLAREIGRNPQEIARDISEELKHNKMFTSVAVAGPGFLNVTLKSDSLIQLMEQEFTQNLQGTTVLVEYSDPNPFKPLHAGHLYTTLVGDSISRLVEVAGAKTIRLNYGGDVGLHVAKSMWAITRNLANNPSKLGEVPEDKRAVWMGERYVEGSNAYEDDELAKSEIIEINKQVYSIHRLNDQDSAFAQIYWTCREWSYKYFEQLYKQLQVNPFDRFIPESEVTPLGLQTVKEQLTQGVFSRSDGAVIYDGEKNGLHTRVFINSEGIPTYETKEVGLSLTKWNDYYFDESIIITANEQQQYMQVVLDSIKQFAPEPVEKTRHLTHGILKMQGGVKMSSRKGNVLLAVDVLDAASQAGEKSGTAKDYSVVLAAIKYAFIKNRIGGDIAYDPEESVAMEGNSGPYLQYAHARARSILSKAEKQPEKLNDVEEGERSLVRKLGEYTEVVSKSVVELAPHYVCTYLYELAQTFNRFYEQTKVIGSDREAERLYLVEQYASRLKSGLELLGIHAPEQM